MTRVVVCCVVALATMRVARADEPAAKALFDQGKTLFAEGSYGEACAKLEASFRLAALSSTRGMLGACYEKLGRLASAWVAYRDAAAIAARQGYAERATAAREKANELEPQLARLTIDVAASGQPDDLRITLDGTEQPRAALGSQLPIDAGPHVIEATALGHRTWKLTLDILDGERQTIVVQPLVPDPAYRTLLAQAVAEEHRMVRRRRLIAYSLLGGGGLGIGVSVTLALLARSQWQRARDAGCTDAGLCPSDAGTREVDGAALKADLATYLGGAGLLLAGAGLVVHLTRPQPRTRTELQLAPSFTQSAAGISLQGRF